MSVLSLEIIRFRGYLKVMIYKIYRVCVDFFFRIKLESFIFFFENSFFKFYFFKMKFYFFLKMFVFLD